MARYRHPLGDVLGASVAVSLMLVEAQWVISMRLWGMAGLWNLGPDEHRRMWSEKATAARTSGAALARAALSGAAPADMAIAALKPVRRRTRANALRLVRRGPLRRD